MSMNLQLDASVATEVEQEVSQESATPVKKVASKKVAKHQHPLKDSRGGFEQFLCKRNLLASDVTRIVADYVRDMSKHGIAPRKANRVLRIKQGKSLIDVGLNDVLRLLGGENRELVRITEKKVAKNTRLFNTGEVVRGLLALKLDVRNIRQEAKEAASRKRAKSAAARKAAKSVAAPVMESPTEVVE
jgi:hypothetical protein